MIAMIFEFWHNEDHIDEYKQHAGVLRQLVNDIDGFISIERFRSEADPGKVLAIGYFENEEAVTQWRNLPQHRQAQLLGRQRLFTNYRLIMAEVVRDYAMNNREQVPQDSIDKHRLNN